MDGKTFVRAFLFSSAYGHDWARVLCSPNGNFEPDPDRHDFNRAIEETSPFARAMEARQLATSIAERAAAEAEMVSLVGSLEKQKALVKSVDKIQTFFDGIMRNMCGDFRASTEGLASFAETSGGILTKALFLSIFSHLNESFGALPDRSPPESLCSFLPAL